MSYRRSNAAWQPFKPKRSRTLAPDAAALVLARALRRNGLDKDIARYRFVLKWPEIVGLEIAKRATPECIRGNALVVRVSDSTWANELSFQKDVILNRLRKHLDSNIELDDVMFYVG